MRKTAAVQAHRGSPEPDSGIRENTLEAFAWAMELGADGVELDVRLTADGGLAVHHDPVIEGLGPIYQMSTGDLPAHVPLLADALVACAGMVVNIEVKNLPTEPAFDPSEQCVAAVVDLLAEEAAHGGAGGSRIITSFWSGALAAALSSGPMFATGLLVLPSFDTETAIAGAVELGCTAIHLPVPLVTGPVVESAHRSGLAVAVWTVADPTTLMHVLDAGGDTVITDDVALARRVIDG